MEKTSGPGHRTVSMKLYRQAILAKLQKQLRQHYGERMGSLTMADIARDQIALRAHLKLDRCDMQAAGQFIRVVRPEGVSPELLEEAENLKLRGGEVIEDAAAGEATRLGLGTKYLLTPDRLVQALMAHNERVRTAEPQKMIEIPSYAQGVAPISVGVRHKLQLTYDLTQLAVSPQFGFARNPGDVLRSQLTLTILNEETAEQILRDTVKLHYFGLLPQNTLFMVQRKAPGMSIADGSLFFDQTSEYRLWNHLDMKAQQTLSDQIFWVRFNPGSGELTRNYLAPGAFQEILALRQNLVSYPVEDIDFLTGAVNLPNLAMALEMAREGVTMTMEVVGQKEPPQTGGFFTFDPILGKVVCIESDAGGSVVVNADPASLRRILWLNKNFNNFPDPAKAFMEAFKFALGESRIPLHPVVKGGHLYIQPPQGNLNLELNMSPTRVEPFNPIRNLKVLEDGPRTFAAMKAQDEQPGFLDLAKEYGAI